MDKIEDILVELKAGKVVIVVDDENRENEGDLLALAETISYDSLNFMVKEGRGLVCVPISQARAKELGLEYMVTSNTDSHGTAFTVSVDSLNTTTGISVQDRLNTIKALASGARSADDFKRPGHIFPLIAKPYGVLERRGHTEAATDLANLCGYGSSGVICEILQDDGTMARMSSLEIFAKKHSLKMTSIEELARYRKKNELLTTIEARAKLPTQFGDFQIVAFSSPVDKYEHVALVHGNLANANQVLVRMHSECLTGDAFGSLKCDCGEQLQLALKNIANSPAGIVLYLRQEGRGIGLNNKIKAYSLQDEGLDTVDANIALHLPPDGRDYYIASQMLKALGVIKIELMTNNQSKVDGLVQYGIEVDRKDHQVASNSQNVDYLHTKKERMGHILKF